MPKEATASWNIVLGIIVVVVYNGRTRSDTSNQYSCLSMYKCDSIAKNVH